MIFSSLKFNSPGRSRRLRGRATAFEKVECRIRKTKPTLVNSPGGLKKRLRYPHTGAQVQQHVARGMEQMRIYLLQYAAGKIAVKWAGVSTGCRVVSEIRCSRYDFRDVKQ